MKMKCRGLAQSLWSCRASSLNSIADSCHSPGGVSCCFKPWQLLVRLEHVYTPVKSKSGILESLVPGELGFHGCQACRGKILWQRSREGAWDGVGSRSSSSSSCSSSTRSRSRSLCRISVLEWTSSSFPHSAEAAVVVAMAAVMAVAGGVVVIVAVVVVVAIRDYLLPVDDCRRPVLSIQLSERTSNRRFWIKCHLPQEQVP